MSTLFNLLLALRNLQRQQFYAWINIMGFALGISVCFFISIFVIDQLSYDAWFEKKEQVYRLEKGDWALLGSAFGPYMRANYPEVLASARVSTRNFHIVLETNNELSTVNNAVFADSSFFDIFPLEFLAGQPSKALTDPYSIVMTRSLANTMFGHTNVIGKTVRYAGNYNLTVSAVIEDVRHFHIEIKAIIPFHLYGIMYAEYDDFLSRWDSWNYLTYVLLEKESNIAKLEQKANEAFFEHVSSVFGYEIEKDFFLRPLRDIYFADQIKHISPTRTGHLQTVRIFMIIAIFILLIAIVNFVNLATARSSLRAKEVGIRRLLGSNRKTLITQFLIESIVLTSISMVLSLVVVETGLPWFTGFADISFRLTDLKAFVIIGFMAAGSVFIGTLAGIYPSIYLTAANPIDVLRGGSGGGKKGATLRKYLIVFQFGISIALIVATLVISSQLQYMKNKDLGLEMEDNIVFRINQQIQARLDAFRSSLSAHAAINGVALSAQEPGSITWQESASVNGLPSKQYTNMAIDQYFLTLMGVKPLEGRLFSRDYSSDYRDGVILNEAAVHYFGYSKHYAEVIGQPFIPGTHIVGIVPDFHYNSLHNPIAPLVIRWDDTRTAYVFVKIDPLGFESAIAHIEKVWKEFSPSSPLIFHSMQEQFNQKYHDENRLNQIFTIFSALAVFIACLGLFGLASFMAERRLKEMAVRKVMGARMKHLAFLLLTDFLKLVLVAFIISAPLILYLLTKWLNAYPYHASITPYPFIVAGMVSTIITILTVSYHAVKVSLVNPGSILKYE